MSTEQHACITIACDSCREPLGEEDFGSAHFDDLLEAAEYEGDRWLISETEQLCPVCWCDRDGHGELTSFGGGGEPWCERCDRDVPDEAVDGR